MAEDDDLTSASLPAPPEPAEEGFAQLSSQAVLLRIVLVGAILLSGVLVELAIATYLWPHAGAALWQGLVVEMFTGREAGIPVSLGGGAPAWVVAQISATQDLGVVCLAYPAFLWALQRFQHRDGFVMRRLRRLQTRAQSHRAFVHRWGPLGIFLFMLVPFLVNGPLVGAAMGRVAGITTKWLIAPVVAATILAATAWTYAYESLFGLVDDLDPRLPPLLTAAIVVTLAALALLGELREERRERRGSN